MQPKLAISFVVVFTVFFGACGDQAASEGEPEKNPATTGGLPGVSGGSSSNNTSDPCEGIEDTSDGNSASADGLALSDDDSEPGSDWSDELSPTGCDDLSNALEQVLEEDADPEPTFLLSFEFDEISEGDNSGVRLYVDRTGNLDRPAEFKVVSSGDAQLYEDFNLSSETVFFAAGAARASVQVTLADDSEPEALEVLSFRLENLDGGGVKGQNSEGILIVDDEAGVADPGAALVRLAADSGVELGVGDEVSKWMDQGSLADDATSGSGTTSPKLEAYTGVAVIQFDGTDDYLSVANASLINTKGPYQEKSVYLTFVTGSDVQRRQTIYEQGGGSRGLNVYLDGGRLYVGAWNLPNDDGGVSTPWGFYSVHQSVAAQQVYSVVLNFDQPNGVFSGYLNGRLMGEVTGVGSLFAHSGKIGIGATYNATYFHDGSFSGNGHYFNGALAELILFNRSVDAGEALMYHNGVVKKFGLTRPQLSLSLSSDSLHETGEGGAIRVAINSDRALLKNLKVKVFFSGTAVLGEDYLTSATEVVIPALASKATFTLRAINDELKEGHEAITLTLADDSAFTYIQTIGDILVVDDDVFTPDGSVYLWYRSEEDQFGDRSQWEDLTGNDLHAFSEKASETPSADGANGVCFAGDDRFAIADSKLINTGGPISERTIAMRFRTGSDVSRLQMLFEEGGGSRGLNIYIDQGKLYGGGWNFPNDDKGVSTPWGGTFLSADVSQEREYLVVLIHDSVAGKLTMYLNGASIQEGAGIGLLYGHSGDIGLGGVNDNSVTHNGTVSAASYFTGCISEFLMFDKALERSTIESMARF